MSRRINDEGLRPIKQWAGFVGYAYDDFDLPATRRRIQSGDKVAGMLTIGYGSTGPHVKPGLVMSEAVSGRLLRSDLDRFERGVAQALRVELSDNQFAALVSFAFNIGEGAFVKSTLLERLNAGDYDAVPAQLGRFVFSKGKRMQGLVNRRAAEVGLWSRGAFASSNHVEARPEKPPLVTLDNALKVGTGATGVAQALTSGVAQTLFVALLFALVGVLVWRWHSQRREAAA